MKIVDVSEFYAEQGGGVRVYTLAKLRAATRAGHTLSVIAPGPEDRVQDCEGGKIIWVKSYPFPFDPRYYLLAREGAVHEILTAEAPDVVEGSSPWTGGWFAGRWKGNALKSFIFHQDAVAVYPQTLLGGIVGGDRIDQLCKPYWSYLRRLSSRFDLTVVSGAWLQAKLTRLKIQNPQVAPFGIDKSQFLPTRNNPALRAQLLAQCGMPADVPLLMTISRHHPEKRLKTIIDAVGKVSQTQPVGLVIFGDGLMRTWVDRWAAKTPGVHVAGFTRDRNELADALASSDVLVHGSSAETFGLVIAEAICSSTPIVVPNQGGAFDLARPDYAETYPPGDATACAAAILRLLRRDPSLLQSACHEGRHGICDTQEHFQRLFTLYQTQLSLQSVNLQRVNSQRVDSTATPLT